MPLWEREKLTRECHRTAELFMLCSNVWKCRTSKSLWLCGYGCLCSNVWKYPSTEEMLIVLWYVLVMSRSYRSCDLLHTTCHILMIAHGDQVHMPIMVMSCTCQSWLWVTFSNHGDELHLPIMTPGGSGWIISVGDYADNSFVALGYLPKFIY